MMARFGRRSLIVVTAALLIAVGFVPSAAVAAVAPDFQNAARTAGVDGRVTALAAAGDKILVGGQFAQSIDPGGEELPLTSIGKFDPASGTFDQSWGVTVDGAVSVIAVDGTTAYLGGSFTAVNGVPRSSLAAVSTVTGALLPWAPRANRVVDSMVVIADQVYVGGTFTTITDSLGRADVSFLARVSTAGTLDRTWSASALVDDRVRALAASATGSVYVGGDFTNVNGFAYASRLALLTTGPTATIDSVFRSKANNGTNRSPVFGLVLSGNSLLIAAGGGGGGCTLQDATTGTTLWSKRGNGDVQAVAIHAQTAYCGGHFGGSGSFDLLDRYKLAGVDLATGVTTDWAPRVNSALGVYSLLGTSDALFAGGDFTKIGPVLQTHFGMFRDVAAFTPPAAPMPATVLAGDGQVLVTWAVPSTDGGSKVTKYQVDRSVGNGLMKKLGTTKNLYFVDATAVNGTVNTYRVSAINATGTGAAASAGTAQPMAGLQTAPSAPTSAAVDNGAQTVALSWAPPVTDGGTPITGYQVYRGATASDLALLTSVPAYAHGYVDSAVTVGTRYYYEVTAVNAVGEGVPSLLLTGRPDGGFPSAPVLEGAPAAGGGVQLDWVPPDPGSSPITKYVITRDSVRIATLTSDTLTFKDTTVTHGVSYLYRIKAVSAVGSSPYSSPVAVVAP